MLDRIASYLRKELETRGKVRSALAYPAVMLVVAVAVTIFLLTYVLPESSRRCSISAGCKCPVPPNS